MGFSLCRGFAGLVVLVVFGADFLGAGFFAIAPILCLADHGAGRLALAAGNDGIQVGVGVGVALGLVDGEGVGVGLRPGVGAGVAVGQTGRIGVGVADGEGDGVGAMHSVPGR